MKTDIFGVDHKTLWEKIKGYKTYAVATIMLLWAGLGYFNGWLNPADAQKIALEALGLAGLRNAIK